MFEVEEVKPPEKDQGKGIDTVSVGKVLKKARIGANFTRIQVEEKTGIGRNRLYRLEQGIYPIRLNEMYALCSLYNLPHSEVMAGQAREVGDQVKGNAQGDPVAEARVHLERAATLLGVRVASENEDASSNSQSVEALSKLPFEDDPDDDEDVSLEAFLADLDISAKAEAGRVKASKFRTQINDALEAAKELDIAELIEVASRRKINVTAFKQVAEGGNLLQDSRLSRLDQSTLQKTLARLLVVDAVYGVNLFSLPLESVERINKALGKLLPNRAIDPEEDEPIVVKGHKVIETVTLTTDEVVRDRMARELLPYFIDAALDGRSMVRDIKEALNAETRSGRK
jgi:transcriptional regulator with XRE-family HTH domain